VKKLYLAHDVLLNNGSLAKKGAPVAFVELLTRYAGVPDVWVTYRGRDLVLPADSLVEKKESTK